MSSPTRKISRRSFIRGSSVSAAAVFAAGIKPISPPAVEASEQVASWYRDVYRQFHIDHEFGNYREIFRDFDGDAVAQIFEEAGIQMVSYFAKCANGYSYYPTKIGVEHPGLYIDFTGEMTRALKKRGIKTFIYFFPARERLLQKTYPGWVSKTEGMSLSSDDDVATMCYQSPYTDEVIIPQMKEALDLYDPDGLFIDIVLQQYLSSNCRCGYCKDLFSKNVGGGIPKDDNDPKAFAYRKWSNELLEGYMEKIYFAMSAVKPDLAVINNYCWMSRYPVTPPSYYPHICWDTPTPDHGIYAWNFSFEARYLAALHDVVPGITWSLMNTRGNTWGDFSLREPEAYMQECAIPLAGCGRTYLSDDAYPSGKHDTAIMEIYSDINSRIRDLEPYLKDCSPVKDAAVLHSADSVWSRVSMKPTPSWSSGPAYYPVNGAHKSLTESHIQMGILNSEVLVKTLRDYNVLVLPGQRILSGRECDAIRSFVRDGGALIATGETGTRDADNNPLSNFVLADVLGVEYLESSGTANCYLRMDSQGESYGIPSADIQVAGRNACVKTTTAKTVLDLVPPYEGIRTGTPPPSLKSDGPGVTVNSYGEGKAVYCAAQVFNAYYSTGNSNLRKMALWMLDLVYPDESRTIVLDNTPVNVEVFYNQRGSERFVHLINYSGDKREVGFPRTQDFPVIHGIKVRVRLPKRPKKVTLVPGSYEIKFIFSGKWMEFEAVPLDIHHVYRIDNT